VGIHLAQNKDAPIHLSVSLGARTLDIWFEQRSRQRYHPVVSRLIGTTDQPA
jgi:hypothetical protein